MNPMCLFVEISNVPSLFFFDMLITDDNTILLHYLFIYQAVNLLLRILVLSAASLILRLTALTSDGLHLYQPKYIHLNELT
jgi:hypothetical protein